jgi:hypothetical protein
MEAVRPTLVVRPADAGLLFFGDLTGEVAHPTLWRGRPRPRETG